MISRTTGAVLVLVVAAGVVTVARPARAAETTCQGRAVTITATGTGRAVTGTDGPDVISTVDFSDIQIDAKGGDDIVCAGRSSTIQGGPGADSFSGVPTTQLAFSYAQSGVRIDLAAGTAVDGGETDTLTGIRKVQGSRYDDTFVGTARRDVYDSGDYYVAPQEDVLVNGDSVDTGAGDDEVSIRLGTVDLGSGDDHARGSGSTVAGGAGDDEILLGSGGTARGGPGRDWLAGAFNPESAVIAPRAFVLTGGPGNDRILPLVGWQPEGGPVVDGGGGRDVIDLRQNPAVKVDLAAGTVRAGSGRSMIGSFEGVVGTRHADVIRGDSRRNLLEGGPGDDVLVGRGGRDTAVGGPGRDRCVAEVRRTC
jgi:Ca2+-binding RTX toxin-like protein